MDKFRVIVLIGFIGARMTSHKSLRNGIIAKKPRIRLVWQEKGFLFKAMPDSSLRLTIYKPRERERV